jgi:hypothetical protein
VLGFTKFPAGRFGGPEPASMLGAAPETDRSHTPPTPIGFSLDQSPIRNELDLFLPWSSLYRCRSVPQLLEAGNTTQPKTKLTPRPQRCTLWTRWVPVHLRTYPTKVAEASCYLLVDFAVTPGRPLQGGQQRSSEAGPFFRGKFPPARQEGFRQGSALPRRKDPCSH